MVQFRYQFGSKNRFQLDFHTVPNSVFILVPKPVPEVVPEVVSEVVEIVPEVVQIVPEIVLIQKYPIF